MLLAELLLSPSPGIDPRAADTIADSLARGDRWVLRTAAAPEAILVVTLAPGHVASLVEMTVAP